VHRTRPRGPRSASAGKRFALGLTFAASLWIAVLVASPLAIAGEALAAPAAVVYAAASRICHQKPERSFALGGVQLPVCARCFGLYVSAACGALLAWRRRGRPRDGARVALALAAVPTASTWGLEVAGVSAFSNAIRAAAALPLGATAGWLAVQMLRYDFQLNDDEIHDRGPGVRVG
jgi:uncharacterized membrane protein